METGSVTTPFGRRPMTLGMLASQITAREIKPDQSSDKWKLFRALCEARPLLGITDRALAVLNALLSFYPKNELSEANGLIVFPSNDQLSLRAHGMAEQTIRRHLAALVDAGLLLRRDSPNGKRYARRDSSGQVHEAFGFSLAPLLVRAEEIEHLAAEVAAERLYAQRLRERISLCRRDISKLIETAVEQQIPGDWQNVFVTFRGLLESMPRTPTTARIEMLLHDLEDLRTNVVNQLEMRLKTEKESGNPNQIERHIQNSNPKTTSELEPSFETKQDAPIEQETADQANQQQWQKQDVTTGSNRRPVAFETSHGIDNGGLKCFPLGLVLQACPQIADYGPGGVVANWRDLMSAAVVVRSMLGVSPSAYEDACSVMRPENAATVIACILEKGGQINSAGGYLRDLTRRAERGEFAIGPMLMALLRANAPVSRRVS